MQVYAHKHRSPSWRVTTSVIMVEEKMAEGRETEDWRRQLFSLQPINKTMAEPGTAPTSQFVIYLQNHAPTWSVKHEIAQTQSHTALWKVWPLYHDLLTAKKYCHDQAHGCFMSITQESNIKLEQGPKTYMNHTWFTAQLTSGNTSLYLHQYKNTCIDTNMCGTIHGPSLQIINKSIKKPHNQIKGPSESSISFFNSHCKAGGGGEEEYTILPAFLFTFQPPSGWGCLKSDVVSVYISRHFSPATQWMCHKDMQREPTAQRANFFWFELDSY